MALSSSSSSVRYLTAGIEDLLENGMFKIASQPAAFAFKIAEVLSTWIPNNKSKAAEFEKELVKLLSANLYSKAKTHKMQREKMWTGYHALRTSTSYRDLWQSLIKQVGLKGSPIFCQYVGNSIFKRLIVEHFTIDDSSSKSDLPKPLTIEETYGLRYAAGYLPRSLRKKITKSTNPLKSDLLLCLFDLLDEGDDDDHESTKWLESINRGGLTRVNNNTYEVFHAMEYEIRRHLSGFQLPDQGPLTEAILANEDVQFFWTMISSDWEQSSATALLELIVKEWLKIRGFSLASTWVEKYKIAAKQTTQKSKGVRKQLISKPTKKSDGKIATGDQLKAYQEPEDS